MKSASVPSGPPTYLGVQALRGVAAVMVVAFHASQLWAHDVGNGSWPRPWTNGSSGVEIFFVISGFVMAVSTIGREHKQHPARSFLERRLIRLVPLYWMISLLVLLKLWFVGRHAQFANSTEHMATTWSFVLASLCFVPYRDSAGVPQALLGVGWSLDYEMFFYLLFGLALALGRNVVRFLTPIMLGLFLVGYFRTANWPSITLLASPFLLQFLAGLLLGSAVLKGWRIRPCLAATGGCIGAVALLCLPIPSLALLAFAQWSIAAYLVVQAAVMTDAKTSGRWPKWLLLLGDASYSLYLSHPLVLSFVVKLLVRLGLVDPGAFGLYRELATIAICLVTTIPVAILLYRVVEWPMPLQLRRHVIGERREPVH